MSKVLTLLRNAPLRLRILLACCLILALAVVVNLAATSLAAYSDHLDKTIEINNLEYQRLSRNVNSGEEYAKLHAEVSELLAELVATRLVKGGTLPLSEAMFQNIVNEWADTSGVSILSMRVLPILDKGDFSEMRMAINTRAEIEGIQKFMELVQQGSRFIFFKELEIKNISAHEQRYYYFNAQLAAWTIM